MILKNEELINCTGGASKGVILGTVGLIVAFLIGVADGYFRKLKCN
ncbi:MAG: hypothetical protein IJB83_00115 [Bacilli bacterium]|nr:hypothetical protein [Bacilli bacterium]